MLYILPPPSAKPPSVWDLIINFHRKGCQESTSNDHNTDTSSSSKKSLKFDCREANKSQRTWCKTSPSDQSHVSEIIMTSKRTVSLSRENQTHGLKEISFVFPPKTSLDFPVLFRLSLLLATQFKRKDCYGKWKPFAVFSHMANSSMLVI